MSRSKSVRLSLLAGSSLVAATLSATVGFAAFLVPAAANAADECTPVASTGTAPNPAGNGVATDEYSCTSATYANGITYNSSGNLSVGTTAATNVAAEGVNLIGTGADSVSWTSTAGTVTGTGGAVIEARSSSGAISINAGIVNGGAAGVAAGIRAISNGGGAVSVSTLGSQGDNGIEAISTGGHGNVSVTTGGAGSGRLRGIVAQSSGTGTLTITAGGSVTSLGTGSGMAAVNATTGAGLLTVNVNGGNLTGGPGASGLIAAAGGAANVTIAASRTVAGGGALGSTSWGVDIRTGGLATITNQGTIRGGSASRPGHALQALNVGGAGGLRLDNTGILIGVVDLSGLAGGATINHETAGIAWRTSGASRFSAGADLLTNAAGSSIYTGQEKQGSASLQPTTTTFAFGGGADTFNNAGTIVFGEGATAFTLGVPGPATTIMSDLERFNNSGRIFLGKYVEGADATEMFSDGQADDRLSMAGTTFNGTGDSTIYMDAFLSGPVQRDCTAIVSADCIDLTGGQVLGSTQVVLRDAYFGYPASYNPDGIVLVDVAGGTASAANFTLSPLSDHYDPARDVLDKGMFVYSFVFDEAQTQFKIVGEPDSEAHQFAPLGAAVQDLWYVSTGSWFDRQADLRQTMGAEGLGASMWFRGAVDRSERDLSHSQGASTFDNSQSQNSWAVTFGGDVISTVADGRGVVAGLMLGYAHADIDFDNYTTQDRLSGMTGGLYASYMNSGFYVDATVNAAGLTVDHDAPTLGLLPAGSVVTGNVETVGAQIETGWRIPLGETIFVEPLAGAAYVETNFDDLAVPAADGAIAPIMVAFDDLTSLRGNVGARIGIDQGVGPVLARYSLTARLWNEFDGEGGVRIRAGETLALGDDVGGRFTEMSAGVALFSADGALSGFLNLDGRFGDARDGAGASAGLRYRW